MRLVKWLGIGVIQSDIYQYIILVPFPNLGYQFKRNTGLRQIKRGVVTIG